MESVLNDCLTPTNEMILNLIEIETSLINTNHPDFIGSADSLLNLFQEPDFIAKKNEFRLKFMTSTLLLSVFANIKMSLTIIHYISCNVYLQVKLCSFL